VANASDDIRASWLASRHSLVCATAQIWRDEFWLCADTSSRGEAVCQQVGDWSNKFRHVE